MTGQYLTPALAHLVRIVEPLIDDELFCWCAVCVQNAGDTITVLETTAVSAESRVSCDSCLRRIENKSTRKE